MWGSFSVGNFLGEGHHCLVKVVGSKLTHSLGAIILLHLAQLLALARLPFFTSSHHNVT